MPLPPDDLVSKHLFIEHLAEQLEAMESGAAAMQPAAYRLYARRLRSALAGYPPTRLARGLAREHPSVADALVERHFEVHGVLPGDGGGLARLFCRKLVARCLRIR